MFCKKCGKKVTINLYSFDKVVICESCGNSLQSIQSNTTPKDKLAKLPNATLTLILGIASIVCCGPITGIIALIVSAESNKLLKENPDGYSDSGNHKAGRICAWIGIGLTVVSIFVYLLFFFLAVGAYSDPYYYY